MARRHVVVAADEDILTNERRLVTPSHAYQCRPTQLLDSSHTICSTLLPTAGYRLLFAAATLACTNAGYVSGSMVYLVDAFSRIKYIASFMPHMNK
jgi:hypothetical protein